MAQKPVAYEGNKPYIFVSYAHRDDGKVYPMIENLQRQGFRIWYDSGIKAGTEWPQFIADHIANSSCVIVCLSRAATASDYCRQEITFAQSRRINMLTVYLEDVQLPSGLQMQLGNNQSLFYSNFANISALSDEIAGVDMLQICREDGHAPRRPKSFVPPESIPSVPKAPKHKDYSGASGFSFAKLKWVLIVLAAVGAIVWVIASSSGGNMELNPDSITASKEDRYSQAVVAFKEGNLQEAYDLFEGLGDYEDSQQYLKKVAEMLLVRPYAQAEIGDTVTFGKYEWEVLEKKNGQALLLCTVGVKRTDYHGYTLHYPAWDACTLREWLNDSFLVSSDLGLTEEYLRIIVPTQITTTDNPTYGTSGGEVCTDRIFILSSEEVEKYLPKGSDRILYTNGKPASWWLRTKGETKGMACIVDTYGTVDLSGEYIFQLDSQNYARPALWVDFSAGEYLPEETIPPATSDSEEIGE